MSPTDGRHARAARTRVAVAEAMLDCFEEGLLRPGASDVAERAGVSTRAVFRHFENMESLIEEAATLQLERVMGQLPRLVLEGTLDERIAGLVERTATGFELTTPVRRAALLIEPFSETIRDRHAWMRAEIRRGVRRALAPELEAFDDAERKARITQLRALISFSYWDELRRHERLSVAASKRILSQAIGAALFHGHAGSR